VANDLTVIIDKQLARGLKLLRKRLIMPSIVNLDYRDEAKLPGATIDVPLPVSYTALDVTPATTPPTPNDTTPTQVQITLDKHKHADYVLTDPDLHRIDKDKHFLPMQAEAAIDALARIMNTDIWTEYKGVFGYAGTAGTTPFASAITQATDVRKTLNQQLCPKGSRRFVLDHDAEANALNLAPFRDASQSNDATPITEGEIGRKLGFDWYADDDVPSHTAGTADTLLVNNGAGLAVGATTAITDGEAAGTVLAGDIITFAGHAQTYTVISSVGGAAPTLITFYPGLKATVADNAAITLKATHRVNLAFHREAIAFATRPIADSVKFFTGGSEIRSLTDPLTNITLRLEVMRQYKQTVWDYDVLYGKKLIRPELACRLAG